MTLQKVLDIAADAGFMFRGAFHPVSGDDVPDCGFADGAGTVVLLGNVGGSMWSAFSAGRREEHDAMDNWTRRTILDVVSSLRETVADADAVFPFGGPPCHPFQRWAMRAEPVYPTPVGPLIHPQYGMWHAYRAALVFSEIFLLPEREERPSPCETCTDQPCLNTCPVSAFTGSSYDVAACANHMASPEGEDCLNGSCLARRACPVGRDYFYDQVQSRFHMEIMRNKYAAK